MFKYLVYTFHLRSFCFSNAYEFFQLEIVDLLGQI